MNSDSIIRPISLRGASMAETSTFQHPDLRNCVVLVAGATRGVGRGIALAFGEAGATVYCTGRSSRPALASGTKQLSVQQRKKALPAADYTGRPGTMVETAKNSGRTGLIVEIGDGDTYTYRGHLFFDLIKTTVIRLAFAMAYELRKKNVAAVAITPGFLRSEVMLERFGVSEATWQDAVKKDPNYICSETPLYAGRAVVALAADPGLMKKSGRVFSTWGLSEEYAFCDADGRRPHWGRHFVGKYGDHMNPCDEGFYKYWFGGALEAVFPDWPS